MGEFNFGGGVRDGDEKEWVFDGGADYHIRGDNSMFVELEEVVSNYFVPVKQWGVVYLSIL